MFVSRAGLGWLRHQHYLDMLPADVFPRLPALGKAGPGKAGVFVLISHGQGYRCQVKGGEGAVDIIQTSGFASFY